MDPSRTALPPFTSPTCGVPLTGAFKLVPPYPTIPAPAAESAAGRNAQAGRAGTVSAQNFSPKIDHCELQIGAESATFGSTKSGLSQDGTESRNNVLPRHKNDVLFVGRNSVLFPSRSKVLFCSRTMLF
jgi:hypothetical protein